MLLSPPCFPLPIVCSAGFERSSAVERRMRRPGGREFPCPALAPRCCRQRCSRRCCCQLWGRTTVPGRAWGGPRPASASPGRHARAAQLALWPPAKSLPVPAGLAAATGTPTSTRLQRSTRSASGRRCRWALWPTPPEACTGARPGGRAAAHAGAGAHKGLLAGGAARETVPTCKHSWCMSWRDMRA